VALQVNELCRPALSDREIRKNIAVLPKDLPSTYQRILCSIVQEGGANTVDKIFRWVAAAKRPLLLEELREAIAVEPGDKNLQRDRFVNNINGIMSWCGNLVTLDEEDLVRFAHHTVKQFLLSTAAGRFHFQVSEINHTAGEVCVSYLSFNDFKRQIIKVPKPHQPIQPNDLIMRSVVVGQSRLAKFALKAARGATKRSQGDFDVMQHLGYMPGGEDTIAPLERLQTQFSFLPYAREYWLSHTSDFTRQNTSLWSVWEHLVLDKHPLVTKPWEINDYEIGPTEYILAMTESHCALLACFLGPRNRNEKHLINYLLDCAIERGKIQLSKDLISSSNYGLHRASEALIAAAGRGHLEMVEMLIMVNADINAPASWGGYTALQEAAKGGHLEVLERLIIANANINAPASWGGYTALQEAAKCGHLEVVERLIMANANINAPASKIGGCTALQAAAEGGHIEVVERLIMANADINALPAEIRGYTALQAAAEGGHLEMVERLIMANADINAPASLDGCTALQAAAKGGHLEMVERLIMANADINAPASTGGYTALQAAAKGGHLEVVERLIMANADINAPASTGGYTALQAAAKGGHLEVVERLIMANADINAPSSRGGYTALELATNFWAPQSSREIETRWSAG
jgi:ankyrin repeat protein